MGSCLRAEPLSRQQRALGISPSLIRNVPKGRRCRVKNWLALLSVSSGMFSPKTLAFLMVFSISSRSCSTLTVNFPTSLRGTTATRVSSKVRGRNFCFQLQALPKQLPSERKTTSSWSSMSVCRLQSPTFPLRTRYRHSASSGRWQTKAFSLNLARNMERQMWQTVEKFLTRLTGYRLRKMRARVLTSATVRFQGSLMSISKTRRRSFFLMQSRLSLLKRISSSLKTLSIYLEYAQNKETTECFGTAQG